MLISHRDRRTRTGQIFWFAAWIAVTGIGLVLHPDSHGHGTHQELGLPPCPSALFFDRPCPGCGLTTSWTALLHGDVAAAFRAHALGPILYLLFTLSALASAWFAWTWKRLDPNERRIDRAFTVGAAVFFAYGIGRMALTPHYRTDKEAAIATYIGVRSGGAEGGRN